MNALTIWQPWASLIASGVKTVETRSWSTTYRGPLAIHAAATRARRVSSRLEADRRLEDALRAAGQPHAAFDELPRGAVGAVARLTDVMPAPAVAAERPEERPYGDYAAGRFGWILEDVVALAEPVPLAGRQRLWNVPTSIAAHLTRV